MTTVQNLNDSGPGSLRQAVLDAVAGDTIDFLNTLDGGTIILTSGQILINKNLSINASSLSNGITISGNNTSRIFNIDNVNNDPTVTLDNLKIIDGNATAGGGILIDGSLTLNNSTISNNTSSGAGGGIFTDGSLTLNNSTISNNTSSGGGGGISIFGSLTLNNSKISNNTSSGGGGGIAIFGDLILNNSTISGNEVTGIETNGNGGGIFINSSNTIEIKNSTITENISSVEGGGIYIYLGSTGTLVMYNTIVAKNTSEDLRTQIGQIFDVRYSLIGSPVGNGLITGVFGNKVGTAMNPLDPILSPLQDNGGPTLTHALAFSSPAIGAGSNLLIPVGLLSDQRGNPYTRIYPLNGTVDMGAYEGQPKTIIVQNTTDSDQGSLRQSIFYAYPNSTITFNSSLLVGQSVSLLSNITIDVDLTIKSGSTNRLMTIVGGLNQAKTFSIFTVKPGVSVTFEYLELALAIANSGAAIKNEGGKVYVNYCEIHDNVFAAASGLGTITCENGGTLNINRSSLYNNTIGGIVNEINGTCNVINSTIFNCSRGGIVNSGILGVYNCTITKNSESSASSAGGITNINPNPSSFKLGNSIVAGNIGSPVDISGLIDINYGYNFIGDSTGATGIVASDKTFAGTGTTLAQLLEMDPMNPMNPLLKNNGGPTKTIALIAGSLAIDGGNNSLSNTISQIEPFHQRGPYFSRTAPGLPINNDNPIIDIGAYEYGVFIESTSNNPNLPSDTYCENLSPEITTLSRLWSVDGTCTILGPDNQPCMTTDSCVGTLFTLNSKVLRAGEASMIRLTHTATNGLISTPTTPAPLISITAISDINMTACSGTYVPVTFPDPIVSTQCLDKDIIITFTPPSGSQFLAGTTKEIKCTASDNCGNSTFVTFNVIVEELQCCTFTIP